MGTQAALDGFGWPKRDDFELLYLLNTLSHRERHSPNERTPSLMFNQKNLVIRDCVSPGKIISLDPKVRSIVDTTEFQRLRFIKQNGLSNYVFPSAEHSRFAHSIGVFGMAKIAFSHLKEKTQHLIDPTFAFFRFDDDAEQDFSVASLVHDIGHTAFSHALEQDLLPEQFKNHEACTLYLIQSEKDIARAIKNSADFEAVSAIISGAHPNQILNDLVSGAFDVDRIDYIRRDSMLSGVEYGNFDLSWLFHSMIADVNDLDQPYLGFDGPRGIEALRQFFAARRHMYKNVYFHATVRAARILLRAIIRRTLDIGWTRAEVQKCPACFRFLIDKRKPTIEEFLRITDYELIYFIKHFLSNSKDRVCSIFSSWFINREFPKCVLDSSKDFSPISEKYGVDFEKLGEFDIEAPLFSYNQIPLQTKYSSVNEVIEEMKSVAKVHLDQLDIPRDIADYLVSFDESRFSSSLPRQIRFKFQDRMIPLSSLQNERDVDFEQNLAFLIGSDFNIRRFFVPSCIKTEMLEYVYGRIR